MEFLRYFLLILLVVCALTACIGKNLLTAVVKYMSFSLIMSVIWVLLQSPDLAITEAAVGAGITSVLYFLTLKKIRAIDVRKKESEDLPHESAVYLVAHYFTHNTRLRTIYKIFAVIFCLAFAGILLYMVAYLPNFGGADNPINNEVAQRYIEQGIQESGAVNIVTGMILFYRAFDTFGESTVLFSAASAVLILLRIDTKDKQHFVSVDTDLAVKPDPILQKISLVLVPSLIYFGVYIILNGHLSPGGGFSGGSIMGAGLILFESSFGPQRVRRFINEESYTSIKISALYVYGIIVSYFFLTGANGILSAIPLGTPGAILSSGGILPINIVVGVEVACTMYAFYSMFRRGTI